MLLSGDTPSGKAEPASISKPSCEDVEHGSNHTGFKGMKVLTLISMHASLHGTQYATQQLRFMESLQQTENNTNQFPTIG